MSLTDMVIMPGEDYQNTCDAIREKTGGTETIKSGQLPAVIGDVYLAGEQINEQKWAKRFYTTFVQGSGTGNLSIPVPFAPDFVIFGFYEPFSTSNRYVYLGFSRNFKSFARYGGMIQRIENEGIATSNVSNNNVVNYIEYQNNVLSFTHVSSFDSRDIWSKNSRFLLIAMKYTEDGKSDEDLLKDYVLSLPDSGGTVTISQRRFTETGMSTDAFNAFTASNKPNWTFVIA